MRGRRRQRSSIDRGPARLGALAAAGYLTIINHGATASALVKASSPDYSDVMLHRTVTSGGMENMEMVDRLKIPARGEIDLSPGNYHLMLMHAKHPVAPGDEVPEIGRAHV